MLDKVKAPMYAPFIMKLIEQKDTGCPLVRLYLVLHKSVRPQRKGIKPHGASEASRSRGPFASSDDDAPEVPVPPPRRPRMKNASNAPIGDEWTAPSREEMRSSVKKASVFEKMLLCMNIDIRKTRYEAYRTQRWIDHNQQVLMNTVTQLLPVEQRPPPSPEPTTESEGTLSFTTWNQGGLVNWKELEEITSGPSHDTGKEPLAKDDDEYEGSGSEDDDEEEEDSD
jgi:hypothetical protein